MCPPSAEPIRLLLPSWVIQLSRDVSPERTTWDETDLPSRGLTSVKRKICGGANQNTHFSSGNMEHRILWFFFLQPPRSAQEPLL
jgi:hypothetical protein